jgi:hypothetical protein
MNVESNLYNNKSIEDQTFAPPCSWDNESLCRLGSSWWNFYPVQDYDYTFNSQGYRDIQHDQFVGSKVNLCIGDGYTMNIGGPNEHSWPFLLSQQFQTPTLNLGTDRISDVTVFDQIELYQKKFHIDKIFILYNYIPQNFPRGSYYQFVPSWAKDLQYQTDVKRFSPNGFAYLENIDFKITSTEFVWLSIDKDLIKRYNRLKKHHWMDYHLFCLMLLKDQKNILNFFDAGPDQQSIRDFIYRIIFHKFCVNRSGYFLSKSANQSLANYFIQQST